ncbi:D-glycero-alpha-D-manno-heptose-1,7-bisphosphate 7-phosphatase [Adhaeribacter rhizoryzae]|uniref:D,D-heptose 1,7-bisphosphate phosphatase n=1 Tax=Adhaeribacter rhizoryzae TaxID=2607907 RepID=A0A5M6DII1_9BACT|nr:HAD-IIIA family hydrolase [Adhaeribacter rhizoryzae]KAA5547397.1 HAD-IIIA family hydrolase [Adhaeribacter rhizoryzae]
MQLNKCVFLDRDGVLNEERGDYTYRVEDFNIITGVPEALQILKAAGYRLVIVTNQGGIAKGLYTKTNMLACHQKLQQACNYLIDAIYYAPAHPSVSASLARKPDSLMLEKAIARFNLDITQSWLVGDQHRDILAAQKVGVKPIWIKNEPTAPLTDVLVAPDLLAAAKLITQNNKTGK